MQAAVARIRNSNAVQMEEHQQRARILPDALAMPRNTDVVLMVWKKLKERISRDVSQFHPPQERLARWKEIEDHVEISLLNGTLTQNMVDVQDFGMEAAKVTTIDSRLRKNVKKYVCNLKEKVI